MVCRIVSIKSNTGTRENTCGGATGFSENNIDGSCEVS